SIPQVLPLAATRTREAGCRGAVGCRLTSPSNVAARSRARLARCRAACSPLIAAHLALHLAPSAGNRPPPRSQKWPSSPRFSSSSSLCLRRPSCQPHAQAAPPRRRPSPRRHGRAQRRSFWRRTQSWSSLRAWCRSPPRWARTSRSPRRKSFAATQSRPAAGAPPHRPAPTHRSPAASHPHSRPARPQHRHARHDREREGDVWSHRRRGCRREALDASATRPRPTLDAVP
ncbi:hypothetical protein EMIHUDRAFT_439979, partial [Emiliania huxleyi CCMP1516]